MKPSGGNSKSPRAHPIESGRPVETADLTGPQRAKLARYATFLADAGIRIGAVGAGDADRIWERHIEDSLLAVGLLPPGPLRCVDVGSGAGLPGVVVAIARPDLQVTLLETRRRRCDLLEQACSDLQLRCTVLCARAESVGRGPERETFDVALCRALGAVAATMEYSLPLVRVGGRMIALRGTPTGEEKQAASAAAAFLGGGDPQWHRLGERARRSAKTVAQSPAGAESARLETWALVVPKEAPTPPAYPRRSGIPSKRPLR